MRNTGRAELGFLTYEGEQRGNGERRRTNRRGDDRSELERNRKQKEKRGERGESEREREEKKQWGEKGEAEVDCQAPLPHSLYSDCRRKDTGFPRDHIFRPSF